jgi:hypothetical protein
VVTATILIRRGAWGRSRRPLWTRHILKPSGATICGLVPSRNESVADGPAVQGDVRECQTCANLAAGRTVAPLIHLVAGRKGDDVWAWDQPASVHGSRSDQGDVHEVSGREPAREPGGPDSFIAMRMYGGVLQYYAGCNGALGASRWSAKRADAMRFATRRVAEYVAHRHGGIVRRVREGE